MMGKTIIFHNFLVLLFLFKKKMIVISKLPELLVPMLSSAMPTPRTLRSQCATEPKTEIELEKSTPYPLCYANLLAGRATGVSTSTSPGQNIQPGSLYSLYVILLFT